MASSSNFNLLILIVSCSVISCSSNGITVDLIHRDSPLSPFYNPKNTRFDRLRNAFHRSFLRQSFLNSASFEAPIQSNFGEYLMKISLGTPPFETLVVADTGSDLTWTQCVPCTACYNQTKPLFNPKSSTSYRNISCKSEQCVAFGRSSCDDNNVCEYAIFYGDQSYSNGELASDTLSLQSSTGESVSFSKTVFGCGRANGGSFNKTCSGIVGLGGGAISIVNQLKKSIGGRFSYCLTQIDEPNVTSKISFGSNAVVSGPNVVSTTLIRKTPDTFYYLNLEGVSVGSTKILYDTPKSRSNSNSIEATSDDKGNIVIDSGTMLTYLPQQFYDEVESALIKAIKGKRVTDPKGFYHLCYKGSDDNLDAPTIVAHFTGADLQLPKRSKFIEVEDGTVCLTLIPIPNEGLAVFGNLHQINYLIGYDLVDNKVSFMPTNCSKAT